MALYYFETSALVKLYVREDGTDRLLSIFKQPGDNEFSLLSLSRVELRSAIRRRQREGTINSKIVDLVLDRFERHLRSKYLTQLVDDAVIQTALRLIDLYALRAYDALQLAGCIVLRETSRDRSPVFACADQRLLQAARSEKLAALDPCAQC